MINTLMNETELPKFFYIIDYMLLAKASFDLEIGLS